MYDVFSFEEDEAEEEATTIIIITSATVDEDASLLAQMNRLEKRKRKVMKERNAQDVVAGFVEEVTGAAMEDGPTVDNQGTE